MAGLLRAHLLVWLAGILLRNTSAQDSCGASDHFALLVHDDGDNSTLDGIYKSTVPFSDGSDFTQLPLETTENPTAVFKDVVEDYVYWAGNDVNIGRYIKRDVKDGGTTQEKSLINTCSQGTPLGIRDPTPGDPTIGNGQLFASGSTANAGPERGRLDLEADTPGLGAWIADTTTPLFIGVNLLGRPVITGVITQGREDARQWTTKYMVSYSNDAVNWKYVQDFNENDAEFDANTDQNTNFTNNFLEPIVALFVRIEPTAFYWDDTDPDTVEDVPALRFELLGCRVPQCPVPDLSAIGLLPTSPSTVVTAPRLGVEDGTILDKQFSQSSGEASDGRLNGGTVWVAGSVGNEYVEVFLGGRATVTGVAVQGNGKTGADKVWVETFQVRYSQKHGQEDPWPIIQDDPLEILATSMDETFNTGADAATDENFIYYVYFNESVSATHIRIYPLTTVGSQAAEMRFEILGCREPDIRRLAVDGTCGSQKVYWLELDRNIIYYADLDDIESTEPTPKTFFTGAGGTVIIDIELDVENGYIYFAQQDTDSSGPDSSSIIRVRLDSGAIADSVEVSNTNGNIQSISIDWDTERVYYSINADTDESGEIGYVDVILEASPTVISTIVGNPAETFYPFDISIYGEYVYALENKDSIIRVLKTLPDGTPSDDNAGDAIVTNSQPEDFARLAVDLQFVKCIDYPTVAFDQSTYSIFEDDRILDVTLYREGDLRCCSSFNLVTEANTASYLAIYPDDFFRKPNGYVKDGDPPTVTFTPYETSIRLQFQIVHDNDEEDLIGEGDEKFRLTLTDPSCAAVGTNGSYGYSDVTIKDYYSCYYVDGDDSSFDILEGDVNRDDPLAIYRKGYLPQSGTINVGFVDNNATTYNDYIGSATSASFAANSPSASVSVTVVGDRDLEYSENFYVELNVPFGATNTLLCSDDTDQAEVSITDNDFLVFLLETHITVSEGNGTVNVPVCRQGYLGYGSVTVPVTIYDTSAEAGSDYLNSVTQVILEEHKNCTNAIITLLDDDVYEPNEAFRVIISKPSKGELGDNTQTYVGIANDDIAVRIEYDTYTVKEDTNLFVSLLRDGSVISDEDVYLVAVSGSATSGEDFEDIGEILFRAGDNSKSVYIEIIDDALIDPSETFQLRLLDGDGNLVSSATVSIEDNDEPPPSVEQEYYFDRSSLEVNEDAGSINVAVIRRRTDTSGSVKVLTSSATATAERDFIPLTRSAPESYAKFVEGSARASVTIDIINDNDAEGDESFTARLAEPTDGTVSSNNILITILDDEEVIVVEPEGDGGIVLSTAALVGIILGAAIGALTLLALAVCGCCILLRETAPPSPPPPQTAPPLTYPPIAAQTPSYAQGGTLPPSSYPLATYPSYGPSTYDGYYARDNRGFRPV